MTDRIEKKELVRRLARDHEVLITVEEGSSGGFSAQVLQFLGANDLTEGLKIRPMTLPDIFQDHDKPEKQYEEAGLTAADIVETAIAALGKSASAASPKRA